MRRILDIFFRAEGANPWLVLLGLIAAGTAEGIGFATLVPLVSVALDSQAAGQSQITAVVAGIFDWFGLTMSVGSLLAVVVGALVIKSILYFMAMTYVGFTMAEVTTNLRKRVVEALLEVRWSYLVRLPVGRIANSISVDAARSGNAYLLAASFVAQAVQGLVYMAVALVVSWKLALVAATVGAAIAASLHVLVRMARRAGWRQTKRQRKLVTFLSDTLGSIKPVKAMARQDAFGKLFGQQIYSVRKALRRQVVTKESLKNTTDILLALALGVGFYLALTVWNVPLVDVLVVGLVLGKAVGAVSKIQDQYQKAVVLESPYVATHQLIEDARAAREPNPGRRAATFERCCRLDRVTFGYGSKRVIDRASLTLDAGTVTVVTGPSGAGKTTIADLLLGFHVPEAGRVLVDDVPLEEIDLESWRRQIGYVAQELVLLHDTVLANIVLGDDKVGEDDVRRALEMAGAWEFVAALPEGLMSVVGERGASLSGGQRQRIALARALLARPKLLILDEVTSALDPATERQICENIRGLDEQMTILAITHRPALLELADRVYHVDEGEVREVTPVADKRPHAALPEPPAYAD